MRIYSSIYLFVWLVGWLAVCLCILVLFTNDLNADDATGTMQYQKSISIYKIYIFIGIVQYKMNTVYGIYKTTFFFFEFWLFV